MQAGSYRSIKETFSQKRETRQQKIIPEDRDVLKTPIYSSKYPRGTTVLI